MTGDQFERLLDRKRAADRLGYLWAGIVASAIYNVNRGENTEPISALDFVPVEKKKEDTFDLTKLSAEEQTAFVMNTFTKNYFRK